ncbi:uncharacterized protein [Nicotiana tomentosiformis]|uniref:uncharacterized protein n=1 Tax=Nicotiana tomentosiformis TaxID=4098 RepID=UPI00388C9C7C
MTNTTLEIGKDDREKFTDIHPRHPLYLYPSDSPGSGLIPQQLTGLENYTAWSNSMQVALLAKNKLGFIDGKCGKEYYNGNLEHEWERYNAFVLSWITNSVSKELANALASIQSNRFRKNNRNRVLQCDYCHMKGYEKENFYKLVGYPPNNKFNKRRTFDKGNSGGSMGPTTNNVSCVEESEGTNSVGSSLGPNSILFFTPEQYNQLLKLINKEPTITDARINMAGIADLLNACYSVGSETNAWVIDTGASNHMVSSLDHLTESHFVASNSSKVHLPNGNTTSDLYNGRVRGIGKEKDGLYILQPAKIPPSIKVPETPSTPAFSSFIPSTIPASTTPVLESSNISSKSCSHSSIGHQRFGHAPVAALQKIPSLKNRLLNKDSKLYVLSGKSPYKAFHGHPPTLDITRVFGCLCYATTLHNTDKFSQRAMPAIFMGYSTFQKDYRLYNISNGTFFVGRDVSFREILFPFKYPKSTFLHTLYLGSTPIFPTSIPTSTCDDSFPASMDPLPPSIPDPDSPSTSSDHPLYPSTSFHMSSLVHSSPSTSHIPYPTPTSSHVLSAPPTILPSAPQHQDLPPTPTAPLRKSGRPSKTPLWLTDFIHHVKPSSSTPYSITDSINYSFLSSSYQTCLFSYSSIIEPTSFTKLLLTIIGYKL